MTRRTIKKVAKCYLDGRNVQRYLLGAREFWIDSNTSKAELVFPLCIEREILAEAMRRGWDGCHWDSPILIYSDSGDGPVYGYGSTLNTRFSRRIGK